MEKNCQVKDKGCCMQCSWPICPDHKTIHELNCNKTKHHSPILVTETSLSAPLNNAAANITADTDSGTQEQYPTVIETRKKVIYFFFRIQIFSFSFKFLIELFLYFTISQKDLESWENLSKLDLEAGWSMDASLLSKIKYPEFQPTNIGPIKFGIPPNEVDNPRFYFEHIWTEEIWSLMLKETNQKGFDNNFEKEKDFIKIKPEELDNFIGLTLLMGIVKMPALHDYWAADDFFGKTNFSDYLARDR
jgi:hypothetical protein